MVGGRALLVEGLGLAGGEAGAVDETLQHNGAIANPQQRAGRHRKVVAHQVELRHVRPAREVQLLRMSHADFVTLHLQQLGLVFGRHVRQFRCRR